MIDGVPSELAQVRANARCLATLAQVESACDTLAAAITRDYLNLNPILVVVMTGGVVPLGMLLTRLDFPLQVDYAHATRYGTQTTGGSLHWIKSPPDAVAGRHVLVVDDILDHGTTLAAVCAECTRRGALSVRTAVLVSKLISPRSGLQRADYSALELPDSYLFGCGMDYKTYLRNAPGIFAVANDR
jgi:hypoxanthine phosphoribosyltransferase